MSTNNIELEKYQHGRDTVQDTIRVGDSVVRRYGKAYSVWRVTRIWRKGPRGQVRFDLVNDTTGGTHDGTLAAEWQRKGDQS